MISIRADYALRDIAHFLEEHGKSLQHYGLPQPTIHTGEIEHEIRRWNANLHVLAFAAEKSQCTFNTEQHMIYDRALDAVVQNKPLVLFIDGKAGTGKTRLVNTICNKVWSMGHIVLPTAIAAFAAQCYAGGRTTHSAFKVCPLTSIAFQLHV